jgi:hypothetical protein
MWNRRMVNGAIAAGLAALAAGGWKMRHHPPPREVPTSGPTGELDAATLAVLMAVARTVTERDVLKGHYADYYAYQAENRPGYIGVYREFVAALAAELAPGTPEVFARKTMAQRWAVLERIGGSSVSRRFDVPIIQETLAVFMRTDAWLLLGYADWPGMARGLENYTRPLPEPARS